MKVRCEIGQRFGEWTVIQPETHNNFNKRAHLCRCSCGNERSVTVESLSSGTSTRCVQCARKLSVRHGGSYSRLYRVWHCMKQRCFNRKHVHYADYGGRGITVCDEWLHSFEAFRAWAITNGYTDKLQIDRIENDGNYHPDNCRFVTPKVNTRKRRNSNVITAFGESKTISGWVEDPRCSVCWSGLKNRIAQSWTPEIAISLPKQHRHRREAPCQQ